MTDINTFIENWAPPRDSKTFVHRSMRLRSGWERDVETQTEYLTSNCSTKDILKTAYRLCRQRVISMTGKSFPITFNKKDSFTDGSAVHISTDVLDFPEYSVNEQTEILLGLATHEAMHLEHTDFSVEAKSKFAHTIRNILEDERGEYLVGEEWPGYGYSLEKVKAYYFDHKYKPQSFRDEAKEIFDCFFKLVRYPKHLDLAVVEKHQVFLRKIKDIITPYPMTFKKLNKCAHKIADLYGDELMNDQPDGSTLSARQAKDILESIGENMKPFNSSQEQGEEIEQGSEVDEALLQLVECDGESSKDGNTIFIKAESDLARYNEFKRKIMPQARALAQVLGRDLTSRAYVDRHLRTGELDDSKLIDAYIGIPNVYMQRFEREIKTTRVALLIDQSGSMDGIKIEDAATAAILIEQAMALLPSELFIYGFTSDHSSFDNDITIYREPRFKQKFTLGSVCAQSNNRDGVCIGEVASRIRKFTSEKILFFVISDGRPAAKNYIDGIAHTKETVEQLSKSGFDIVQIGIGTDSETQAKMFKNFVTYSDSSTMVREIGTLLKKMTR